MENEETIKIQPPELTLSMANRIMEKYSAYFEEKGLTRKGKLLPNQNPAVFAAINAANRGG